MKVNISAAAAAFYKQEIPLEPGDTIRFFVRVGGVGSGGFSVGIMKDSTIADAYKIEKEGITFVINEDDFWYFDGLSIDYDSDRGYMIFEHTHFSDPEHPLAVR